MVSAHASVLGRSEAVAPEDGRTPKQSGPVLEAASGSVWTVLTVGALVAAVAGIVLFCFDPRQYHFYPVCFFHQTTGLLCPGCGALRASHQLLHGHLAAAFRFNPVLVVSLPLLLWFGARFALQKAKQHPFSLGLRPVWLWLFLTAVLVVSVLRNLPGTPFAMLRP
ncbi:MAG: DUF2752 domain-containing protein [Verrucomicrobia bacterium]|nr:DUF2752 domain-containing protein [Verrucomicrobiota bacterium]